MKRPKSVTVVLPAQGVEGAIASVVRDLAVAAYALRSRQMALDVLLLAGDADRTAAIATATARQLGLDLTAVPAPEEGPGQAFLDGFRQAAHYGPADLVVTMDATGHHDATQIPHLIDRLMERDLHVVIGSRWARGAGTPGLSARRWALGRAANSVFRTLTGAHEIRDATTSFRVARAEVVRDFDMIGIAVNSYSVQTAFVAMAIANGYRVGEVPIIYWPAARPGRPGWRPRDGRSPTIISGPRTIWSGWGRPSGSSSGSWTSSTPTSRARSSRSAPVRGRSPAGSSSATPSCG